MSKLTCYYNIQFNGIESFDVENGDIEAALRTGQARLYGLGIYNNPGRAYVWIEDEEGRNVAQLTWVNNVSGKGWWRNGYPVESKPTINAASWFDAE